MKIIKGILMICIVSVNVNAASNETERNQLEQINNKAIEKTENSKALLDETIKDTIENLPEQKKKILELKMAWDELTKKKCRLLIFESINTDAQIAMENSCLSDEYTSEKDFFENLNY